MPGFNAHKDIQKMIEKYVDGTASTEEIAFVESYYAHQERNALPERFVEDHELLRRATFNKITNQLNASTQPPTRMTILMRVATVAAVLLLVSSAAYILLKEAPQNKNRTDNLVKRPVDIAPGINIATLTLADGSTITLDDKADGNIKDLPGLAITKTHKGELIYSLTGPAGKETSTAKNTITTPRGGQYQVFLPDGTHVWLNAASSLTYPQSFTGKTRSIKLEGEAYFEVAKNKDMPFHVSTGSQDVEVTGTHFNINGYVDDETIQTTLLEGGITVHHSGHSQRISPGQQASVLSNSARIKVDAVDTETIVAWKNGVFEFNNASLSQIMKQLERWYDIKVDYSSLPSKRYNGMVPRGTNLSGVLKMLELTGNIKFKIEDHKQLKVIDNP